MMVVMVMVVGRRGLATTSMNERSNEIFSHVMYINICIRVFQTC